MTLQRALQVQAYCNYLFDSYHDHPKTRNTATNCSYVQVQSHVSNALIAATHSSVTAARCPTCTLDPYQFRRIVEGVTEMVDMCMAGRIDPRVRSVVPPINLPGQMGEDGAEHGVSVLPWLGCC